MRLDVLIPTKDRGSKLALTLTGLFYQDTAGIEVRVVMRDEGEVGALDDRDVRQAWDLLSSKVETLYVRSKVSGGLVHQRNKLLKLVTAEYLLWLDDDILLYPANSLMSMLDVLTGGTERGFVIPVLLDVDNARMHNDYEFEEVGQVEHRELGASKHYVRCKEPYLVRVWRGNGGCMMSKTKIMREVVKYDFIDVTTGEGEDMIASILIADKYICFLTTHVTAYHLVEKTHQWSWAKVAGSLVREFLKGKVSEHTLDRSGILSVGYKVVEE